MTVNGFKMLLVVICWMYVAAPFSQAQLSSDHPDYQWMPPSGDTWPLDSRGVPAALLHSDSSIRITAEQFEVPNLPFNPYLHRAYPLNFYAHRYEDFKFFFAVRHSDGVTEGVVWQDMVSKNVYLTWMNLQNGTASSTITLPSEPNMSLLAAVGNGAGEIIYMLLSNQKGATVADSIPMWGYRVDSSGTQLVKVSISTGATSPGLNIYQLFASGGSLAWDVAAGKVCLIIARKMTKATDGLNHQGAIAVIFDAATLAILSNRGQTSGHSWANSVAVDVNRPGSFIAADLGDNYPRGIHLHSISTTSKKSKLVYAFKTQHGITSASPARVTYDVYSEISTPGGTTYYKWSNDNNVYTQMAHPGALHVPEDDSLVVVFSGERPSLDSSLVGAYLNAPRNLAFIRVPASMTNITYLTDGPVEIGGFYTFGGVWKNQTNKGVVWLTDFTDMATQNAERMKSARVTLADGTKATLILYELWEATRYSGQSFALVVRDDGTIASGPVKLQYNVRFGRGDELAMDSQGRLVWYHAIASTDPTKYILARFKLAFGTIEMPATDAPTSAPPTPTPSPTLVSTNQATISPSPSSSVSDSPISTSSSPSPASTSNVDSTSSPAPSETSPPKGGDGGKKTSAPVAETDTANPGTSSTESSSPSPTSSTSTPASDPTNPSQTGTSSPPTSQTSTPSSDPTNPSQTGTSSPPTSQTSTPSSDPTNPSQTGTTSPSPTPVPTPTESEPPSPSNTDGSSAAPAATTNAPRTENVVESLSFTLQIKGETVNLQDEAVQDDLVSDLAQITGLPSENIQVVPDSTNPNAVHVYFVIDGKRVTSAEAEASLEMLPTSEGISQGKVTQYLDTSVTLQGTRVQLLQCSSGTYADQNRNQSCEGNVDGKQTDIVDKLILGGGLLAVLLLVSLTASYLRRKISRKQRDREMAQSEQANHMPRSGSQFGHFEGIYNNHV